MPKPAAPRAEANDAGATPVQVTLAGGRYVLGRTIGAGGMGIVRHARDQVLHRDVAVKLLADNLAADPTARTRFLREARAAARIVHPNVVGIYDVATDGDRPYLVMELVDGPSLADILAGRGPMPVAEVAEVAAHALSGIGRAHDVEVLHRDVKPGNLLRSSESVVKVTDFGVAEAADVTGMTRTGTVLGTLSYLAPERRRGEVATVRTDLYALGVTLAELITGEPPEPGTRPDLPQETPPGLRHLIAGLLATDPDERPTDTADALALLSAGASTPGTTPGRSRPRRGTRPMAIPVEATGRTAPARQRRTGASGGSRRGVAIPAAIALAVLALTLGVGWLGLGGADGTEVDTGRDEVERVPDDPAGTARNLAEWLREQPGD